MARKKIQQPQEEQWITAREATAILRTNSGRDDIPDSYIRSLVRSGKVEVKELDGRTNLYRHSDVTNYVVERRDKGKGDTKAARAAGSRRKRPVAADVANSLEQEQKGEKRDTTE